MLWALPRTVFWIPWQQRGLVNSVDLLKEMQSLVGKLLFDELFHSATQLVKLPHDIKNSRLILRCLWFFTEPTETKTQKKLLHRLKPVPHEYSENWLESHSTEKTYQSNHFCWYYCSFRCFITLPFLPSAQVCEGFLISGLFTLSLVLLILEIGLLSTIKSCWRLCKTDGLWTLSPVLT